MKDDRAPTSPRARPDLTDLIDLRRRTLQELEKVNAEVGQLSESEFRAATDHIKGVLNDEILSAQLLQQLLDLWARTGGRRLNGDGR